jgi:RsiW-degrading membrane proteinase PrsW (M82 family)
MTVERPVRKTHPWRHVLAWGVVLWGAATVTLALTEDLILLPSVVLIGSFLVPVATIFWFIEHRGRTELDEGRLVTAFFVAGVLGMICSAAMEIWLLPHRLLPNLWVGLIEEAAKGVGIYVMARGLRRFDTRDGILLGTVIGLGFGAFESAGYTMSYGLHNGEISLHRMISEELLREVIAPFCHGIWTGLLGAAIFAARRQGRWFSVGILLTYLAVSLLHTIWDSASNAAVVFTVLISGQDEFIDSLSPRNLPFPADVTPQWLFGVFQWTLMIIVAIIGVWWVRRHWHHPASVRPPETAPGDDV